MNKKKENNFESALKRLEEISDLLENEDTPLEDSIKLFEEGVDLKEFCDEYMQCDLIAAHNIYFDRNMIQLEISRNKEKLPSHYVENVFSRNFEKENFKTNYCTMYNGRNICNIKRENDKGETYVKCPKLSELYEHLFEEPVHGNLHNSLVDTYVCLKCLVKMRFKFDMKDRGYDAIMSHNKYS